VKKTLLSRTPGQKEVGIPPEDGNARCGQERQ